MSVPLDYLFKIEARYKALAREVRASLDEKPTNDPKTVRCGEEVFFALTIQPSDYLGCDFVYDPYLPSNVFHIEASKR